MPHTDQPSTKAVLLPSLLSAVTGPSSSACSHWASLNRLQACHGPQRIHMLLYSAGGSGPLCSLQVCK